MCIEPPMVSMSDVSSKFFMVNPFCCAFFINAHKRKVHRQLWVAAVVRHWRDLHAALHSSGQVFELESQGDGFVDAIEPGAAEQGLINIVWLETEMTQLSKIMYANQRITATDVVIEKLKRLVFGKCQQPQRQLAHLDCQRIDVKLHTNTAER